MRCQRRCPATPDGSPVDPAQAAPSSVPRSSTLCRSIMCLRRPCGPTARVRSEPFLPSQFRRSPAAARSTGVAARAESISPSRRIVALIEPAARIFGINLVPSRFHCSGGIAPETLMDTSPTGCLGWLRSSDTSPFPSRGFGTDGGFGGSAGGPPDLARSVTALVTRKTSASNATSAGSTNPMAVSERLTISIVHRPSLSRAAVSLAPR